MQKKNTLNVPHTHWRSRLPGRHRTTNFVNLIEELNSDRHDFDFVGNSHFQSHFSLMKDALPKHQFQAYFNQ